MFLIINVSVYKEFTSVIIFIVVPDEGLRKKSKHIVYLWILKGTGFCRGVNEFVLSIGCYEAHRAKIR